VKRSDYLERKRAEKIFLCSHERKRKKGEESVRGVLLLRRERKGYTGEDGF